MKRSDQPLCTVNGDGIILSLHIQPRASKNEVCGVHDNALKIRLTSPPVDGAANKLCREFLAGIFDVPKSAVEIIAGETSRHKRISICDSDTGRLARVLDRLASQGN
ncbi:MAG: DUF167 family protein [Desulfuromonadaceae bacterium]|nr:DUF167 family protein [Desulfuromonadaceae bacterium]